mgnify:CR=1 FL=1
MSAFHLFHLHGLNRWSILPRQRQLPIGFGTWRAILDRLGRFVRQEAAEREETATELERLHAAVDLMRRLKAAWDPLNILNPGKVVTMT